VQETFFRDGLTARLLKHAEIIDDGVLVSGKRRRRLGEREEENFGPIEKEERDKTKEKGGVLESSLANNGPS